MTSPGLVQTSLYCIEMDLIGQQLEIKKWPHIRPWDDTCLAVLTTKWCPCAKAGSSCPQVLDWGVWMGKLVIYGLIFWNYVLLLLKGKNSNWKLSVMGYLSSLNSGAVETLGSLRAWWSGTYQTGSFGCWGSMTQLHAQILSCLAVELSGNWKLSGNLVTWWTTKWAEMLELDKSVDYLWESWKINNLLKVAQFWIIPKFW